MEGDPMPAPLSNDIRSRIVGARKEGGFTYDEIADRLSVGRASVVRILRLERETGCIEPKKYRPGPPPKVDERGAPVLLALLNKRIDATEEEQVSLRQPPCSGQDPWAYCRNPLCWQYGISAT